MRKMELFIYIIAVETDSAFFFFLCILESLSYGFRLVFSLFIDRSALGCWVSFRLYMYCMNILHINFCPFLDQDNKP